jgi:AAA15 family ATPase/GTPase
MIDHLRNKNFLAFSELDVPEVKLTNLVAGKNGVGKMALLEALVVLKSRDIFTLSNVITDRKLGATNDVRIAVKM